MATNALRAIFAESAHDQAPRVASASRGSEEPTANVQALRAIAPERTRDRSLRAADASRLTFVSHFVICLAVAAGAFFAAVNNVPQTIFADDLSMMTSVIGALFVGTTGLSGMAGLAPRSETGNREPGFRLPVSGL